MAHVGEVRIAELIATLSYAADLGFGQPMEHCMRHTVMALRLADLAGAGHEDREATYYLGMLVNTYCHADASEQARWYGTTSRSRATASRPSAMSVPRWRPRCCATSPTHGTARQRVGRVATLPVFFQRDALTRFLTDTQLGSEFAERIGLDDHVVRSLRNAYEQWDGKGPRGVAGGEIPPIPR